MTKSVKNVVYELDGKPALSLNKMYFGAAFSRHLPGSGLKFPLAVIEEGKTGCRKNTYLALH